MDGRETFNKLLRETKDEVIIMGSMAAEALGRSVEALQKRDLSAGHQIIADDSKIDEKRFNIEEKCKGLIATQQPVASELNSIIAILNIITELERIGDYATGIAKIVIMIGDEPLLKPLIDIPRMSDITIEMIQNSLKAFIENDYKRAIQVVDMDEVVDSIYDQIFRELLTFMMTDPKTISRATRLIWVAHNIERAADRATNICERVVYMVTGKMEEIGASKY
jgi:phosphate transport system protein